MIHPNTLWLERKSRRHREEKRNIIGQFFCFQWWSEMNWLFRDESDHSAAHKCTHTHTRAADPVACFQLAGTHTDTNTPYVATVFTASSRGFSEM